MAGSRRRRGAARRILTAFALSLLLGCPLLGQAALGGVDAEQQRRSRTGVKLFKALLAADLGLDDKTVAPGARRLLVVVYYRAERDEAAELASLLAESGEARIKDMPLEVALSDDPGFAGLGNRRPAAVFLAEPPPAGALERIVAYGVERGIVVYSPFEGHVERGVHAGLSIEAQVRPYVNRRTLEASGIGLKRFFLKVTKVYP